MNEYCNEGYLRPAIYNSIHEKQVLAKRTAKTPFLYMLIDSFQYISSVLSPDLDTFV
jgi:hypothetical protein